MKIKPKYKESDFTIKTSHIIGEVYYEKEGVCGFVICSENKIEYYYIEQKTNPRLVNQFINRTNGDKIIRSLLKKEFKISNIVLNKH